MIKDMDCALPKKTTAQPSQQEILDANDALWRGISLRREYLIHEAIAKGADLGAGPSAHVISEYPENEWTKETLPLTALFLSARKWSTTFDRHAMDFKSVCKTMIVKTSKKHYGVRDGTTPLLAYSQINGEKQRHSLCKMILRRTPKGDLGHSDELGHNALYYFIQAGRVQDVKAVVEAGLDPAWVDPNGKNSLHWESERRLRRQYIEQKKRDITLFLLEKKVPLMLDNEGGHPLVLDSLIPLAAVRDMDINTPGPRGETLAMMAFQHFCWSRWRELLDDPRTDWMAQIPSLDAFIEQRRQRSFSNDKEAPLMYEQIVSIRQQIELERMTPKATGRARHRL